MLTTSYIRRRSTPADSSVFSRCNQQLLDIVWLPRKNDVRKNTKSQYLQLITSTDFDSRTQGISTTIVSGFVPLNIFISGKADSI